MRRRLAAIAAVVLIAWVIVPAVRAYLLVAAHPSEVRAPADLQVQEIIGLTGWTIQASVGAPAVVLVHGFKSSRVEMLPWARFLHAAGYNLVLFDTRGCGERDDLTIGLGATEPSDISRAVRAASSLHQTRKVAVLGVSLGAGAAILAAAEDPAVSAVIADSAWPDQDFTLARLSYLLLGPARLPLPPYGAAAVNALVGADVSRARPLEVIGRIAPRPVLLIHSADDDNATTPVDGARRMIAAAGDPKELWIAPRGGHAGAIAAVPDEYRTRVLAFLARAFG